MLENLLKNVVQEMSDSLSEEQLKDLQNSLYIQFHGKKIVDDKNELQVTNIDSDTYKVKMFVASKKISGRQDSTLAQYVREIKSLRNMINKNFEDMTTMDIRYYLGTIKNQNNISMITVQNKIRSLNSFFTFLQEENYCQVNPISKIETLRIENTIKKAFSVKELESLKLFCKNNRDRALVEFLYTTGVRVSELCSLDIKDIDLYKQEFIVMGKGRKERILYISDSTSFHLDRYLQERMERENLTFEQMLSRPLFATLKKPYDRLTKGGVQYIVKTLGREFGIENVHPHRFRRTFATDLLNRGMKIEEVMVLMGHTKIETTLIYCNIKTDKVREAYRKYI